MASITDESGEEDCQQDRQQYQPDQNQQDYVASWMAKIDGSPIPVTLGDEQIRIVGIVVDESRKPVSVVVAGHRTGELTGSVGTGLRACATYRQEEANGNGKQ